MDKKLEERIQRAVVDGRKVRSTYYTALGLSDEQQLGPPASLAQLTEIEARIGKSLPPSYRTFLCLYDGWRMATASMELLSVAEMLGGPRQASIRKWQQRALEAGDSVAGRSLVIAVSVVTPTKLLLDPETVDAEGEWECVSHHKDEEISYPSFLAWLEESVEEFREILKDEIEDSSS
jgi:hypothetical protein